MTQHFWIAGTDTDIGKTLITTYFLRYFQAQGKKVVPYKPVQTGIIIENGKSYYGDTTFYQTFSKEVLVEEHLNSYSFKAAASPHFAARLENTIIESEVILDKLENLKPLYDYLICEGAGGLYVPLDDRRDYHLIDLIKESQLPVILVARTTLGTINHTLLSIEALKEREIPIIGIVFNAFQGTDIESDNIRSIQHITDLPTMTIPRLNNPSDIKNIPLLNSEFLERVFYK
ncbi:dethiobiotin synthase [Lysinibacillus yapensis]|uniref:ATP-dependent dethiobiotin synthetase BioD n=1 Tax=Ureibacillus yapensis TaxID=2304605 RepID=A0A396SF91_9BACL|nr:dethiobiotin synthase [Lysinibacillus yapensis]RHW37528.1 dethiobiotin synthase [Lysinibacillus yapensis]